MPRRLGIFACSVMSAVAGLPLPWTPNTWTNLPIFAFPGCSPTFMNQTQASYFANSFSNLLIWGVNATCLRDDGSTFPPYCASSTCYCNQSYPETQVWALNMESSLAAQAAAIKAASSTAGALPILGYIEGLSAQQYYAAQNDFMHNESYASLLLSIESKGLIDCYHDGCNWQGVEYRQYDLRQAAAREFYTNQIIGGLISSPSLDGTFIDVIDWWTDACGGWGCTPQEASDLAQASLVATTEMLQYAKSIGKVLSISCHSSSTSHPAYYNAHIQILTNFSGNAIRFYEFFTASELNDAIHEAQDYGLALHVHTGQRTLSPDWVELAAFLIAANDQSSFSYSQGAWMFDSFPMMPEFSRPLGAPLGPPVLINSTTPYASWAPLPGVNLIFDLIGTPNASVPGTLAFLGLQESAAACIALAHSNATNVAVTWVSPALGSKWALGCYARYDAGFTSVVQQCIDSWNPAAPCWTSQEADCVSAVTTPISFRTQMYTRDFEHLHVEFNGLTQEATLAWSQ